MLRQPRSVCHRALVATGLAAVVVAGVAIPLQTNAEGIVKESCTVAMTGRGSANGLSQFSTSSSGNHTTTYSVTCKRAETRSGKSRRAIWTDPGGASTTSSARW
jgi:hypothetical protein